MNNNEWINLIESAIKESYNGGLYNKEIWNNEISGLKNEFLFFIKPEITLNSEKIQLKEILKMITEKMASFEFAVQSIRILTSDYLNSYDIIARHYGVINKISGNALNSMTLEAKKEFKSLYNKNIHNCKILGSLEFLQAFPSFNATSLDYIWQNGKTQKLAGGTYSQMLKIDSEEIYLLNGFHPRQLEHFTLPGRCIVVFTLVSNTDWSVARNDFIGKTNPAEANPGSIRNELLKNKEILGLDAVTSSWNGVHLSAGPIESLVEMIRYSSDYSKNNEMGPDDTDFGKMLIHHFGMDNTLKFMNNINVTYDGKEISVFDLTEEKNPADAIKLLSKSDFKKE
jgi:hypothetical protein